MTTASNRLKKIVYDYDLQSGKVDKVSYQHGYDDQFYHLYTYDAENRIRNVQTSADSLNWDNDAFYAYYLHGPLSRTILGEEQVQGINYAYTLQGSMKGVNPAITGGSGFSIQSDGASGSPIASNAYNLQLNYHYHDFIPISGAPPPDEGINAMLASDSTNLFNGNIASMGVNIFSLGHPLLYNYHYDQLNRLVHMNAYNNTGGTWAASSAISDFQENVTYDPNGNILTYHRNGNYTFTGSSLDMDKLAYFYKPNTNQLDYIYDTVSASNYPNDIDAQSSGNYTYDAIGELVRDNASNIYNIAWTVYGKIKSITKPHQSPSTIDTTISFTYDAAGNRISKTETAGSSVTTTWYVRDAHGNTLAIYTMSPTVNGEDLTLSERDLYGISRLGLVRSTIDVAADSVPAVISLPLLGWGNPGIFVRGNKVFELSNHLGNALATVSDRHYGVSSDGSTVDHFNPVVLNANDYYPFGSFEPGRTYASTSSSNYRYGFNGKESDDEVKGLGEQLDYGERIYDPRIGKFLSTDPLAAKYPGLSAYQFAGNNPIEFDDLDGAEQDMNKYQRSFYYSQIGLFNIEDQILQYKYLATLTSARDVQTSIENKIKSLQSDAGKIIVWQYKHRQDLQFEKITTAQEKANAAVGAFALVTGLLVGEALTGETASGIVSIFQEEGFYSGMSALATEFIEYEIMDKTGLPISVNTSLKKALTSEFYKGAVNALKGEFKNYAKRGYTLEKIVSQLNKSINSLTKTVDEHIDKITHPEEWAKEEGLDWSKLSERDKEININKWTKDIKRNRARIEVYKEAKANLEKLSKH